MTEPWKYLLRCIDNNIDIKLDRSKKNNMISKKIKKKSQKINHMISINKILIININHNFA